MQTCPSLLRSGVNRSDKIREHVVPVSLANFDAAVGFVHVGMLVGPAGLDSLASPAGIVMLVALWAWMCWWASRCWCTCGCGHCCISESCGF